MKHGFILIIFLLIASAFFTTCENPMIANVLSDYYRTIGNPNEVKDYLLGRRGGWTVDDPVTLRMDMDLSGDNWIEMFLAIGESGKYINLDLSKCDAVEEDGVLYYDEEYIFKPYNYWYVVGDNYSSIVSITLPEAATKIWGNTPNDTEVYAFKAFSNLRHVSMPNVIIVGRDAFAYECKQLQSVDMPKVKTIEDVAFVECTSLNKVYMPVVEYIGRDGDWGAAFKNCIQLVSVTLPSNITFNGDDPNFHITKDSTENTLENVYTGAGTYRYTAGTGWAKR